MFRIKEVFEDDSLPVEDAQLALHVRYADEGHGFRIAYDGSDLSHFSTNADGYGPPLYLSNFRYRFEVTADGFRQINSTGGSLIEIPEGIPDDGTLTIQLETGGRMVGQVLDEDGKPVADAKIALRTYLSETESRGTGRYVELSCAASSDISTDAQGRFTFTSLEPAGAYTLHAYHPEKGVGCSLDVSVGSEDVLLRLHPTASLHGDVRKGSKTITVLEEEAEIALGEYIEIDFVESIGPFAPFNDQRILPYDKCKISIFTNREGAFRVDHLFPGATYRLTIPFEGKKYMRRVTLGPGTDHHIIFDLDTQDIDSTS